MELWVWILLAAVAAVGILLGIVIGIVMRKKVGENKIGSAEAEAKRIKEDAAKEDGPEAAHRLYVRRPDRSAQTKFKTGLLYNISH